MSATPSEEAMRLASAYIQHTDTCDGQYQTTLKCVCAFGREKNDLASQIDALVARRVEERKVAGNAALHAAERAVLDACVGESMALDAVCALPGQLRLRQRYMDVVRSRSIKVRSYRALIEAASNVLDTKEQP